MDVLRNWMVEVQFSSFNIFKIQITEFHFSATKAGILMGQFQGSVRINLIDNRSMMFIIFRKGHITAGI